MQSPSTLIHGLLQRLCTTSGRHGKPVRLATGRRNSTGIAFATFPRYSDDETEQANSYSPSAPVRRRRAHGPGIHGGDIKHLGEGIRIRYMASDERRQTIPWVEYLLSGNGTVYGFSGNVKPGSPRRFARWIAWIAITAPLTFTSCRNARGRSVTLCRRNSAYFALRQERGRGGIKERARKRAAGDRCSIPAGSSRLFIRPPIRKFYAQNHDETQPLRQKACLPYTSATFSLEMKKSPGATPITSVIPTLTDVSDAMMERTAALTTARRLPRTATRATICLQSTNTSRRY